MLGARPGKVRLIAEEASELKPVDRYTIVGLRGRLALAEWAAAWTPGEEGEDVYSMVAKWSTMLGLAAFSEDPYTHEHWRQGEAGGVWTQDGGEHLLAWLQALDVPNPRTPDDPRRAMPFQAIAQVLDTALSRVGTHDLTEMVAAFALARIAPTTDARIATGRDWLRLEGEPTVEARVLVAVDVIPRPAPDHSVNRLIQTMESIAGDVVTDLKALPPTARRPSRRQAEGEPPAIWRLDHPRIAFECAVPRWDTVTGAWLIELVAWACSDNSLRGSATVSVRRI